MRPRLRDLSTELAGAGAVVVDDVVQGGVVPRQLLLLGDDQRAVYIWGKSKDHKPEIVSQTSHRKYWLKSVPEKKLSSEQVHLSPGGSRGSRPWAGQHLGGEAPAAGLAQAWPGERGLKSRIHRLDTFRV